MQHALVSGAPAHEFTDEERSRGGKAVTFNNLKHGKYAKKLGQIYVCPSCTELVPAGNIAEQDALIAKLATKEDVYHEIKRTLVEMQTLLDGELEVRARFTMLSKLTDHYTKIWERQEEKEEAPKNTITFADIMEKKKEVREYKSRQGHVRWKTGKEGEISRGPYKLSFLQDLLRRLLEAQKQIDKEAPEEKFKIILEEELHEIRKLWITEKGDWQDSVPSIYKEIMGKDLDWRDEDYGLFSTSERKILAEVCDANNISTDMVVQLLEVERQISGMTKRASAYTRIDSVLKKEWRSESEVITDFEKNRERKKGLRILPN